MPVEIFLSLDDVKGESKKSGFEGKIDLNSYGWAATQSATRQHGTGGGSGQATVHDISITKYMDSATPVMFEKLLKGKHFDKATITVRKVGGGKPLDYLVIDMEEIIISSYSTGTGIGGDDRITESMSLNFARFKMTYTLQDVGGGGQSKIPVSYDIAVGPTD